MNNSHVDKMETASKRLVDMRCENSTTDESTSAPIQARILNIKQYNENKENFETSSSQKCYPKQKSNSPERKRYKLKRV